jgi:hypothetical protein
MVSAMKPSEAILLGSTQYRAVPGQLFTPPDGACVWGMALAAVGAKQLVSSCNDLAPVYGLWPWTFQKGSVPCGCPCFHINYARVIAHLFDRHVATAYWTLEQLVDWVRSVEPESNAIRTPQECQINAAQQCVLRREARAEFVCR